MEVPRIKGKLVIKALSYIKKKWGSDGFEKIQRNEDDYKPDAWYPLSEFCNILKEIRDQLADGEKTVPFQIGRWMIISDVRWAAVFKGQNPGDVFTDNKNQDHQYVVGDFKGMFHLGNQVDIHSTIWTTDKVEADVWAEFYRGRLKGVLELTGYIGDVEKILELKATENTCTYQIHWAG